MNPHLRFALLLVGLVGLIAVILLIRFELKVHDDPTAAHDRLLVILGVGIVAVVVSYVLTLRRRAAARRALQGDEAPAGEAPVGETPGTETQTDEAPGDEARRERALGIERLVGKKAGRIVNTVVLALVGMAALFLVGLLGYMLYIHLFSGP